MKKTQIYLIIVFSVVVLKYNLSAFVQPLWFERIPQVEAVVSIRDFDASSNYNAEMAEFKGLVRQRQVNSG